MLSLCLWCCLCLWRVPWSVINDVFCAVSLSGTASSPTAAGKAWSQSFCCTCLGRHPFDGEEFLSRTHHGARKMFVNVRVLRQWCMFVFFFFFSVFFSHFHCFYIFFFVFCDLLIFFHFSGYFLFFIFFVHFHHFFNKLCVFFSFPLFFMHIV